MSAVFFRSRDAASPWMVLISVCLHAAGILAIVVVSFTISRPTKPLEPVVTPVTVVSEPIGPPVMDTVAPSPVEAPPEVSMQEVVETPLPSKEIPEVSRETVEQTKLIQTKNEPIQLAKRKKPLKSLEAQKPPEKPKDQAKKKEPVQKKEDPKDYLAQRMAAISKEVEEKEKKKKASSSSSEGQVKPAGPSGRQGSQGLDEESARWIRDVKNRIRSHWSVTADAAQIQALKVKIGVNIAENGELRDVSVDKSSGDEMFDNSAVRAVKQAAPFPPVPPQMNAQIKQQGGLGLNFKPGEIQ